MPFASQYHRWMNLSVHRGMYVLLATVISVYVNTTVHRGRPAVDSSWFSVSPRLYKRCKLMVSRGCDICLPKIQAITLAASSSHNKEPGGASKPVGDTIPKPDGLSGDISGACLNCCKPETGTAPTFSMSRCSKCQLVRYCSVACQTADWGRHKKICRHVKSISESGPDDNVVQ
ncbi:hypothetical protein C8R43DRAFT_993225 [Mycena crocata]|nr:hypothetical protein C8R43DRAFT_993225 [Mycena crocata]